MLMVSDLIELARGASGAQALRQRAPARFSAEAGGPVVVWNVCRHCNMTCPHCYVAAGLKPSPGDLDTSQAKAVIDDLARSGVRVVIFSGGEPLLRADLFELLHHARERGLSPQLSTNGVLVDADVARRLADAGVGYVGVSLDGAQPFNDAYRGLPGGFDRAVGGLRAARAAGLRTGVRITVTRRNADQVDAVLQVADDVGASRFYVSHLVYAGRGLRVAGDDLSPAETRALLFALFDRADRRVGTRGARVVTGSNDSDGPLLVAWLRERHGADAAARVSEMLRQRGGNSAGEKMINIDHRGLVHPDQFWQGHSFGRLPQQPLADVLRHPLRADLVRREELLEGRCGACVFKAECRGSHRERALAVFGNPWAEDPACVMTDAEIRGRSAALEAS